MPTGKILVVEDQTEERFILSRTVKAAGLEYVTATCSQEIITALNDNEFDGVVFGINHRNLECLAHAQDLKKLYPDKNVHLSLVSFSGLMGIQEIEGYVPLFDKVFEEPFDFFSFKQFLQETF